MNSEKSIARCTILCCSARVHQKSQHGIRKNFVPKFPIFSAHNLPSCELVVFVEMNWYILTQGRDFKTLLRENYAIVWDSYYLLTKKC